MIKSTIKEIGIILLLIVVILLVLVILFYDYRPSVKKVPTAVEEYSMPEQMQEELQEQIQQKQEIVKTYKVDSSDLNKYEKSNDYDKGRINPFETISSNKNENTNTENSINKTPSTGTGIQGSFLNTVK